VHNVHDTVGRQTKKVNEGSYIVERAMYSTVQYGTVRYSRIKCKAKCMHKY
jgi:hypothetical protein